MAGATTHILRASLRPKLYRDIEIDSGKSLYDLAEGILRAFDFDLDHAFGFYSKLTEYCLDSPIKYELFADLEGGESDAGSVKHTKVAQAFPDVGSKMLFLFDYGDEWRFKGGVVGMGGEGAQGRDPKVVATVGKAPPPNPHLGEKGGGKE